ncbi:MAG: phenylpyruvate tautomerase MIF-related protein [Pseudomonadota bacterium]
MPFLRLQTSALIAADTKTDLMAILSETTARVLCKPETYMMVALEPETSMMLGGNGKPAAMFEVRSVGTISLMQAKNLSKEVSAILTEKLGVPANRIYSNFAGVEGTMWGHDGGTFG